MSRSAHLERQQRWLLSTLPEGLRGPIAIYDRYLSAAEYAVFATLPARELTSPATPPLPSALLPAELTLLA